MGGGEGMNTRAAICFTRHIVTTSSIKNVLSHENIPKCIQNREHCSLSRKDNTESIKARVVILVSDILSCPVCHKGMACLS